MLVLSRERDESIVIGDKIVVTIIDIRGDKVRLGIEAPEEIPVHRQEVYEAIQREAARRRAEDPADPSSGDGAAPEGNDPGQSTAKVNPASPPEGRDIPPTSSHWQERHDDP